MKRLLLSLLAACSLTSCNSFFPPSAADQAQVQQQFTAHQTATQILFSKPIER